MKITPLTLPAQRNRARALATAAASQRREAEMQRQRVARAVHSRITSPEALALALVGGLLVGTLAPSGRRAMADTASADERPALRHNPAVRELVRAARGYLIGRITTLLVR